MHIVVFIIWVISLVFLAGEPVIGHRTHNYPYGWGGWGLFAFDLWIGLHFLIETADRVTL